MRHKLFFFVVACQIDTLKKTGQFNVGSSLPEYPTLGMETVKFGDGTLNFYSPNCKSWCLSFGRKNFPSQDNDRLHRFNALLLNCYNKCNFFLLNLFLVSQGNDHHWWAEEVNFLQNFYWNWLPAIIYHSNQNQWINLEQQWTDHRLNKLFANLLEIFRNIIWKEIKLH